MGPDVGYWIGNLLPQPVEMLQVEGVRVAFSGSLAATYDLHELDSGLALEADPATSVRVELVAEVEGPSERAIAAVASAAVALKRVAGAVAAQPGVLLPNAFAELPGDINHGALVVPQRWEGEAPYLLLDGSVVYLLQVLGLTDDEYEIARDQGLQVLERRLRRRGTIVKDWEREA